jgi:hypothetical protein
MGYPDDSPAARAADPRYPRGMVRASSLVLSLAATIALASAACGGSTTSNPSTDPQSASSASAIANPSGTCTAPDSGARAGYHSTEGAQWLLDCTKPLKREYWRVFAVTSGSAYIMPRPDGARELAGTCADPAQALHAIVVAHALCAAASSSAAVAKANDIPPADALAIAHHMHGALRFVADGGGITPFPIPSDIVDACDAAPTASDPALDEMCKRERGRLASGNDVGFSYTGPGAVSLAARLNRLYGIVLD